MGYLVLGEALDESVDAKARQLVGYWKEALEADPMFELFTELCEDVYARHRQEDFTWDDESEQDLNKVEEMLYKRAVLHLCRDLLGRIVEKGSSSETSQ